MCYHGFWLYMPVRLATVKNFLEALQMFREALCQVGKTFQSAEA